MTSRATQADLLEQRIAENRSAQEVDLVSWIFERVLIEPADQILELCCGTGGQTLRMLGELGKGGSLVALDTSAAALETLKGKVSGEGSGKLTALQANLDELVPALQRSGFAPPNFNLIFCAYGLYYSQDPRKTLDEALTWLKPNGRIVVVGPYGPNNGQLFEMVQASGGTLSEAVVFSSAKFMLETVIPWASLHFETVKVSTMVNPVRPTLRPCPGTSGVRSRNWSLCGRSWRRCIKSSQSTRDPPKGFWDGKAFTNMTDRQRPGSSWIVKYIDNNADDKT